MIRNILFVALIATMLIGPSVATTIEISTCPEDGFGMIPLAENEYCQEMEVSNGPAFWVSESGMVQYLGDPVQETLITWFNYWTYTINPLTGGYVPGGIHKLDVVLRPCAEEPPVCDFVPLRDTRINIAEPVLGEPLDVTMRFPGNGVMGSVVYLDGTESEDRVWNGESCVVVELLVNGQVYARDGITV